MGNHQQLDREDIQDMSMYMFSVANGNHILRYTECEYRDFLAQAPEVLIDLLIIYHASSNWGYEDARMFEDYDEQWLAQQVDPAFKSGLDFDLPDFAYDNLPEYQQVMIAFTKLLITELGDWSILLRGGSLIERIYTVLACNIEIEGELVVNKDDAMERALEMYRSSVLKQYQLKRPFEAWELGGE